MLRTSSKWKIFSFFLAAIGLSVIGLLSFTKNGRHSDFDRFLSFREECEELLGDRSGAILAMDPHNGLVEVLVNQELGVQKSTRPGSAFKLVTALALLQSNTLSPEERLECQGQIQIEGKTYTCWLRDGHGRLNLVEALANSCNVYFYQAATVTPFESIRRVARLFLLGECTGINVPAENAGQLPEIVSEQNKLKLMVGQSRSLAVTPIQMLRLIAAIANGGYLYRPFNVQTERELEAFRSELVGMIHFGRGMQIVREGMRQSVAYGTSRAASLSEIMVAGKTGTSSQYFGYKTDAWFAGFAPFENPEIAVVVFLEDSRGAVDAAPLAREVFRSFFRLKAGERPR